MTILAICGLRREARIAAGEGVTAIAGGNHADLLREKIEQAMAQGASGLISFGIAGGLAPYLKSGDCVVASEIVTDGRRIPTDAAWTARMMTALGSAILAPVASADRIVMRKEDKAVLFQAAGAHAADTESHIVALLAARQGLPFVSLRTISDVAGSDLPPLVHVAVTADGGLNIPAIVRSLVTRPRQIPAVIWTARESEAAFGALLRCRRALGLGLCGPDRGQPSLDMR